MKNIGIVLLLILSSSYMYAQGDTIVYNLILNEKTINITGKDKKAMAINDQIPGPVLKFKEGDYAVIYVKNEMKVESSVHWHGLILPNFYDGVPYLTTPPIMPGGVQKYEFPLVHSGTYWYHSHTGLQEQSGIYGAIVIEPKENKLEYDKDLVLMFSDWTNENPNKVLKNLKRRNEWYSIKRNTVTPLAKVITNGGLSAQMKFWRQRMPGADIADVYYNAFLTNGKISQNYTDFKPGEKVRIRMINSGASSYFWITFGGGDPTIVSADGTDVVPVKKDKLLFAIAETYDFIVTVPANGKLEIRATSMDGSGSTSAFIGTGDTLFAPDVSKPDYVGIMKEMAKMDMKMGAPSMIFNPKKNDGLEKMKKYGMKMEGMVISDEPKSDSTMNMSNMEGMKMPKKVMTDTLNKNPAMKGHKMDMKNMDMSNKSKNDSTMNMSRMKENVLVSAGMGPDKSYDFLKAIEPIIYDKNKKVKEIEMTLNGNMWRYIWSMNGKVLAEADNIEIKKGEVVRMTMKNLTMMNHPMHLHGHFFRVLNKNGEYSPLKHTVNVAPMQSITIEFDANESGDWFFHCHVLYHMKGGMARVFSYSSPRDPRLKGFPVSTIVKETNKYYTWGTGYVASQMGSVELVSSNVRNQFNLGAQVGWNKNFEGDFSYERYLSDYFRVYGGINVENSNPESLDNLEAVGQIGIRYLLPYFISSDLSIDNQLRPQIAFSAEYLIFRRIAIFGRYENRLDFGVVNQFIPTEKIRTDLVINAGLDFILSRNSSVTASYDNRFGIGGGLTWRF